MTAWSRSRLVAATVTAGVILAISRDDIGAAWWWVVPMVVGTTCALAGAVPTAHTVAPPGLLPLLLLGSLAVTYACVPETDHIAWLTVGPVTLMAVELLRGRRVPSGWAIGVAYLVWWAGVYGATGRGSAYVGAWFAWWPTFVLAAMSPWAARVRRPRWLSAVVAAIPLVVATGVVARTGALEPTVGPALVAVGVAAPVSAGLSALLLLALRDRSTTL